MVAALTIMDTTDAVLHGIRHMDSETKAMHVKRFSVARDAVRELAASVRHDCEIRCIDAGLPMSEWKSHLSPRMRTALSGIVGGLS